MAGNRKATKTFTPENRAKWKDAEIEEFFALSEEEEHLDGSDESANDSDNINDEREFVVSGYSYRFHINLSPFLPCVCVCLYIYGIFILKIISKYKPVYS